MGSIAHQTEDTVLIFQIEGRGGFIEKQNGVLAHQRSGDQVIGAVELVDRFTPGRIRLEGIQQSDAVSIWPFVLANTKPGCQLITDGNPAYVGIPGRKHYPNNLSKKNALPAHISMKWIHRVFSNLKRWGLGTFHGFRDKHINAYANEFVFRWNRRRHFAAAMNTLLGIGKTIGSVRYQDIVGDTSSWRDEHRDQIWPWSGLTD